MFKIINCPCQQALVTCMCSLTQNPFQFVPSNPHIMLDGPFLILPLLPMHPSLTCCLIFSVFDFYTFFLPQCFLFYLQHTCTCTSSPLTPCPLPLPLPLPLPVDPSLSDKAGFGNNFTTGDNKSVAQNMEAVVVGCMFKSLITRCASTTHELHSPENLVSNPPQPARQRPSAASRHVVYVGLLTSCRLRGKNTTHLWKL